MSAAEPAARPVPLATVTTLPAGDGPRHAAAQHPAGRGRQDARPDDQTIRRAIVAVVRIVEEVTAGRRPFPQLEALLSPSLTRRIGQQLRREGHRATGPATVRRVHLGPSDARDAVEATAVIERDGRVTALAVRLERHEGGWRATELTAPDAGYAPLSTASRPRRARHDAFDEAAAEAAARQRLAHASRRTTDRRTTDRRTTDQRTADQRTADRAEDPAEGRSRGEVGDAVVVSLRSRRGSA